jgi:SNF2 family DNA or RNA helicase
MTPYAHQAASLKFCARRKLVADFSDPGTGKSLVQILDFAKRNKREKKAMQIFAPKSLLKAAWANDIQKFAPQLTISIAWAANRKEAMQAKADVYITNIDAATDLVTYPKAFWSKFDTIVVDESTAIKNPTAKRSKALAKISKHFKYRRILSGTPMPQSIVDLWHQIYLLDEGKRLGPSFRHFRAQTCVPEQNGPEANNLKWIDRPGIEIAVTALLSDILIRHRFEDCVDIPENHAYKIDVDLSARHRKFYRDFEAAQLIEFKGKTITAVNAAALNVKLLQLASGASYNDQGDYSLITTERYELTADLVEARAHSTVWYQWRHQLEELRKEFDRRKLVYAVWNPDHPEIADEFQAGRYQALLCHPQNAAHGLTLTRATSTILCSPTFNLEHYLQLARRIYRIGQKQKTETIVLVAPETRDEVAWLRMLGKKVRQDDFFTSIEELRKER